MVVPRCWAKEEMYSHCLMDIDFTVLEDEKGLEINVMAAQQ